VAVLAEGADIGQIAAVTFTNKAAGELKLRLRQELDRARSEDSRGEPAFARERALRTLKKLRSARSTLSAARFCASAQWRRWWTRAFRELTELESRQISIARFRGWVQEQLNQPSPGLSRALIRLALDKSDEPPLER
jgi:hypothetical protein